jgi:hypothetical protein
MYLKGLLGVLDGISEIHGDGGNVVIDVTAEGMDNKLKIKGDFAVESGYSKSSLQKTKDYGTRALYAFEMPDNKYGCSDSGKISDGQCQITFDPIFVECVNLTDYPYQVVLTPCGECTKIYVSNKADTGFMVICDADIDFDYLICAKHKGLEEKYLEKIEV